ncbi:MAG: YfhO family protein [Thermoplasmatales archaeon]|nr:YfhO family protein [Thermoplasmatales archaeon]
MALVVGVSLAAIQLLPSFELSQHITRAGGESYVFITSFSFPPQNLVTTILPNFFGNPVEGSYLNVWNYWELSLYVGILTLILISFAIYFKRKNKYVLFFTGLAILSLLLAMGRNTPLYWILWKFVPGFDMFRVPSRFLFLFTFSAAILAGFGFSFLKGKLSGQEREKIWKFNKILIIISILLVFIIGVTYFAKDQIIYFVKNIIVQSSQVSDPSLLSIGTLQKIDLVYGSIVKDLLILLVLVIGCIIILTLRTKKIKPFKLKNLDIKPENIFKIAVILFILSNLWFYNNSFIITKNSQEIYSEPDYIVFLKENSEGFRYYDVDDNIMDNFQIIYGINGINGYDPLRLTNYFQVITCIHNLSDNQHHPMLNLLHVKYILTSTQLNNSGFKLVFDNNDIYIYENEQVLPRAFVVYNVTVKSDAEILQTLKTDSFNPIDILLTDKNIDTITHNGTGLESVEITKYSPNEIIFKTNLTQPGFLVLSEVFYPEWNAYVDGKEQEIYPAYSAFRAIFLDAGAHVVKFSYTPSSLMMGFYITLFALIFIAIIISIKLIIHFNVLHLTKRK